MGVTENDVQRVASAASRLPAARGNYLETDFVMNVLATVVGFQMQTTTVERALNHFKTRCWGQVRTLDDLQRVFARYTDDQSGNTALAEYLWGYKLWTRAAMLRRLVTYFDEIGVRDQAALHAWAATSEFKRDFEGRVKGARSGSLSVAGNAPGCRDSEARCTRPSLRRACARPKPQR